MSADQLLINIFVTETNDANNADEFNKIDTISLMCASIRCQLHDLKANKGQTDHIFLR